MKIHASGEDYLEAILILQKQMGEGTVRSVDLARHMRKWWKPTADGGKRGGMYAGAVKALPS